MTSTSQPEPVVLLAEDSEDDAYFFGRAFTKASVGCSLLRAGNGKAAIEVLNGGEQQSAVLPFLVFLDLKMPVMNGFEVLEWLGESRLAYRPRVIVLSGSNDQSDRARAERLGADDYLVKPVSPDVLRDCILAGLEDWKTAHWVGGDQD